MNQSQTLPAPPAIFFDEKYINTLQSLETKNNKNKLHHELNEKVIKYGFNNFETGDIDDSWWLIDTNVFDGFLKSSFEPKKWLGCNIPCRGSTIPEMKKTCKANGLKGYSKLKRAELAQLLMKL